MKKLLFLLALCFSVGVMAETSGTIDTQIVMDPTTPSSYTFNVFGQYESLSDFTQQIPFEFSLQPTNNKAYIPPKSGYGVTITSILVLQNGKQIQTNNLDVWVDNYYGIYNNFVSYNFVIQLLIPTSPSDIPIVKCYSAGGVPKSPSTK